MRVQEKYYGISKSKKNINKYDLDYVSKLKIQTKSSNESIRNEALEALRFLDAFLLAEIDSNFTQLNKIIETTIEFKREIYNERYHSRNCVLNTKDTFYFENERELIDSVTLGEAKELLEMKKLADKRATRKPKKATSEKEVA